MTVASRRAANERKARYRKRQNDRCIVVPVTVTDRDIEGLIEARWLRVEVSEDRQEVGRAIGNFVADTLGTRGQT